MVWIERGCVNHPATSIARLLDRSAGQPYKQASSGCGVGTRQEARSRRQAHMGRSRAAHVKGPGLFSIRNPFNRVFTKPWSRGCAHANRRGLLSTGIRRPKSKDARRSNHPVLLARAGSSKQLDSRERGPDKTARRGYSLPLAPRVAVPPPPARLHCVVIQCLLLQLSSPKSLWIDRWGMIQAGGSIAFPTPPRVKSARSVG